MELCHPIDESSEMLAAAHTWKLYLLTAHGGAAVVSGRRMESRDPRIILLWGIGVRGLLDRASTKRIRDFSWCSGRAGSRS